jgi:hypothetical protein
MMVPVEVDCRSADYRVTVAEPSPAVLHVQFRGPGHVIDGLGQPQSRVTFRYALTADEARRAVEDRGQMVLTLRQGFAALAAEGASAEPLGPANVVVRVESVRQIKVHVDLSAEDRSQMAEALTIKPADVLATVPASAIDRLNGEQFVAVPVVNLETRDLLAGRQSTQRAILRPSVSGLEATFSPPEVLVTLRLLAPLDKATLSGIRIMVEGPPEVFARYNVVLDEPVLNNLKVKGPKSELGLLKPDDVKAVLVLQADDKPNEGSYKVRPLDVRFPEGSHVSLDADTPPRVNFNLKERAAPAPAAPVAPPREPAKP